jgi:hypothetical protein
LALVALVVLMAVQEELTEVTLYFQLLPLLVVAVVVAGRKQPMEKMVDQAAGAVQVEATELVLLELELQIKVLTEALLVTLMFLLITQVAVAVLAQ